MTGHSRDARSGANARARRLLVVVGAVMTFAGCDLAALVESAPTAACSEFGSRCLRPEGVVGICRARDCRKGETAPCFTCTPQH